MQAVQYRPACGRASVTAVPPAKSSRPVPARAVVRADLASSLPSLPGTAKTIPVLRKRRNTHASETAAMLTPILADVYLPSAEIDHLLQVAAPWLATVIGALAFALSAPGRLTRVAQPARVAIPLGRAARSPGKGGFVVAAVSAPQVTKEGELTEAFDAATAVVVDVPALETKQHESDGKTALPTADGQKADLSYVFEWAGLDAGGDPSALQVASLAALNAAAREQLQADKLEAQVSVEGSDLADTPTLAKSVTTEPDADEAAAASTFLAASTETTQPGDKVTELQKEYDAKVSALKSAATDAAYAELPQATPGLDEVSEQQRTYDSKLATLKDGVARKERDQANRWQARVNLVERLKAATKGSAGQEQGSQPTTALARLTQPALGLARVTPKAFVRNLVETFSAIWTWLRVSVRRFTGGQKDLKHT